MDGWIDGWLVGVLTSLVLAIFQLRSNDVPYMSFGERQYAIHFHLLS